MNAQGTKRRRLSICLCIFIYVYFYLPHIAVASPAPPMLILECIHIYAEIGKNSLPERFPYSPRPAPKALEI